MKVYIKSLLIIFLLLTLKNLQAQEANMQLVIVFAEDENIDSVYYGSLHIDYDKQIEKYETLLQLQRDNILIPEELSQYKNIRHVFLSCFGGLYFMSILKDKKVMQVYFSADSNDNGYRFVLKNVKFRKGTYYLNLYDTSGKKGLIYNFFEGNTLYYMKNHWLYIEDKYLPQFELSKQVISANDILVAYNQKKLTEAMKKILKYFEERE